MKIGILTSSNDMLTLFRFLNQYEHQYYIYYDNVCSFWGDKDWDIVKECISNGIDELKQLGVDKIILAPMYELIWEDDIILPLFKNYLYKYCFAYSLVGKVGVFGDWLDISLAKKLFPQVEKGYTLSLGQMDIKKFHRPMVYWYKETRMWKYFLTSFSFSNFMVNKTVKFDLRYFKDAGVDTVIPLNYGYFNYQRVISKFFNFKKTRFHKIDNINNIFYNYKLNETKYEVNIICNSSKELITRDKKLMYLLGKGKGNVNFI